MLTAEGLLHITVDSCHIDHAFQGPSQFGPLGHKIAAVAAPRRIELYQPHCSIGAGRKAARCHIDNILVAVVQPSTLRIAS